MWSLREGHLSCRGEEINGSMQNNTSLGDRGEMLSVQVLHLKTIEALAPHRAWLPSAGFCAPLLLLIFQSFYYSPPSVPKS